MIKELAQIRKELYEGVELKDLILIGFGINKLDTLIYKLSLNLNGEIRENEELFCKCKIRDPTPGSNHIYRKCQRFIHRLKRNNLGGAQAIDYKEENKLLFDVLARLVDLKNHKDQHGKDELYLKEQPLLWKKAREVLLVCDNNNTERRFSK